MAALFGIWDGAFFTELARDFVVPCIGSGFVLAGIGWLVGYVVSGLFDTLTGAFRV